MLKKKALKKILITTLSCFILLVLYLIPGKLNNSYLNPKIDVIYTSNVYNSEIYLLGENNYLVKTNIMLKNNELKDKIKEIIEYLKINSKYKHPIGLKGILNNEIEIKDIDIKDNETIINFNDKIFDIDNTLEERVIESLIYSITSLSEIDKITIKINDNILNELPSKKKVIRNPLSRDFGINKVYDITNRNGIKKVVLLYSENISNNNYYVPVTKYVNDDREKIKIIIDNLSSSYINEDNLSSYLRSDIKLLDYKNENSVMEINFNKDIFPTDKVLETVEYTLSYSIFENYDIDKLILKVNGIDVKEIKKCFLNQSC